MGLEEKGMNGEAEGEVKEGEISHSEMKPKEEGWMRRKRGGLEAEGDTERLPQDCRWRWG